MTVEQPSRRVRALPVLVTAAGVFVALVLLEVVPASVSSAVVAPVTPDAAVLWAGTFGMDVLLRHLPLAVGALLVLWRVTPLSPVMRIVPVVARGLLAALAGGVLVAAVAFLANEVVTPNAPLPGGRILDVITAAFGSAVRAAPVTVLAAVLLWLWMQRNPLPHLLHALGDRE